MLDSAHEELTSDKARKKLQAKQKESIFHGVLKSRLVALGYTVATPEPDIGEDLWIANYVDKVSDRSERRIYRAQLKSARREEGHSYEVNDYLRTLDYAQSQSRFVYIFGLHDERLDGNGFDQFHIGCVPAAYWKRVRELYPGAGPFGDKSDRFGWQIKVKRANVNHQWSFVCNIRNAANFNLTEFFADLEYGLRVADGTIPMPEPKNVPDRYGGKRRKSSIDHQTAPFLSSV